MSIRFFNLAVLSISVVVAYLLVPVLNYSWTRLLIADRVFHATTIWWDVPHLLQWLFELLWSFCVGLVLGRTLRGTHAIGWTMAFVTLLQLLRFATSKWGFGQGVGWPVFVLVYGRYVVPGLGASVGAFCATRLWPTRPRGATSAA